MVKKWSDVAGSPDFAALADDDKDTVRSAYFEKVVAPNVAPDQVDATRAQFETAAGYHRRSLPAGVKPSDAQGGRGAQGGPTAAEIAQANTSRAPGLWEANSTVAQDPLAPPDTAEPPAPGSSVLDQPYQGADLGLSTAPAGPRVRAPAQSQDRMQETPIEQRLGQDIRSATGSSGFGAAVQGTASGIAGLGKVVPGLVAAGADVAGAESVRDFALGAAQKAENFSKSVEPQGGYYNKLIGNVFASTVQSLPTMAFGLEGGGAEIIGGKAVADIAAKKAMANSMRELFVQTAGQEYADARNNGSSPIDSAARASIFGAAEVLGERFGFHEQMAVLRATVGKKAIPTHQLGQVLATEIFKEIPGEELTTALEFLADKYGPAGMSPKATLADYLDQAADTAIQTVGQTALMGAPALARHAGGAALRRANAAIAYDQAAINGFHVEPPLATDSPDKQRAKTIGIFQALAAQSGLDPDAEARAVETAKSMPAEDVGPFLNKLAQAFQKRGLVAKPIEEHAADALVAGPIDDPKLIEQQRKETEKAAEGEKKAPASTESVTPPTAAEEAVGNIDRILNPAQPEDLSGLSEPSEPVKPQQESDLTTGDGQPYGTRGSAAARATREGAGEVVRVQGGWVVRTDPAQNAADEPARHDVQPASSEPTASPAGGGGERAGSQGTVEGVAADPGAVGAVAPEAPVAGGRAAEPVRTADQGASSVGPRVIATIGVTPNSATPLELRPNKDGTSTPWNSGHEVVDFESGDPVKIPGDATDAQALDAVKKSGAFGRRTKYFQTHATTAAGGSSTAPKLESGETPGPGKAETPQSTGATHAAQEISQPASVQGEPQGRDQGGQAPEAGGGNRVQRAGPGEEGKPAAQEAVAPAGPAEPEVTSSNQPLSERERKELDGMLGHAGGISTKDMGGHWMAEATGNSLRTPVRSRGSSKDAAMRNLLANVREARNPTSAEVKPEPAPAPAAAAQPDSSVKAEPAKPRTLSDTEAFSGNYAAFTGRTVDRTVPIAGGSRTATLKMDARKTMQALDTRLKALEELKTCIGARS